MSGESLNQGQPQESPNTHMTYWYFYTAESRLKEAIQDFAYSPDLYNQRTIDEERQNIHVSFGELVSCTVNDPELDTATQANIISSVFIKADEDRVAFLGDLVPDVEYKESNRDWIYFSTGIAEWINLSRGKGTEKHFIKEITRAFSTNLFHDLLCMADGLELEDLED